MDPIVQFENVSKNIGRLAVVKEISGMLSRGEIISLVGPSGCGKSTLLRLVAGVEDPSSGRIHCHVEPEKISFVFQDVRLLPWKTALDNITFVLRERMLARWQQIERARQVLNRVGLSDFHNYYPSQLSGGMKKRVAVARALATDPELILLDEPFSDLDLPLRLLLIEDIHSLLKEGGKTAIYVTHDIREALTISDRIYVLSARPSTVREIVILDGLPRDTWQSGPLSPELNEIEARIISTLQTETRQQMEKMNAD